MVKFCKKKTLFFVLHPKSQEAFGNLLYKNLHLSLLLLCVLVTRGILELRMLISVNHHSPGTPSALFSSPLLFSRLLSSTSPEQQGNAEDGRLPHGALARHRKRWQQHQEGDGGDGLPHPFSRLQQEQPGGEKQPGPSGCGRHTNLRRPQRRASISWHWGGMIFHFQIPLSSRERSQRP